MKVYIASDHGGYSLKEELKKFLDGSKYQIVDLGNSEFDPHDDYPDFIIPLAEKVSNEGVLGIIIGRSGNGEAIAANKVKGVRAALCMSEEHARNAKEDNDANILSLAADFIDKDMAKRIVNAFLQTSFSGEERHKRRIDKITSYESSNS